MSKIREQNLTRRAFLRTVASAGAVALLPGCGRGMRLGGSGRDQPTYWALLSDTHIDGTGIGKEKTPLVRDRLQRVLTDVLTGEPRPVDLLINGDLAFGEGRPEDYLLLRELLDPIRAAGIHIHLVPGNHDDRDNLRRNIGPVQSGETLPGRRVEIVDSGGVRMFLLDSLIRPNYTPGELGDTQLAWLGRELDRSGDRACVIFVHHHTRGDGRALRDESKLIDLLVSRPQVKAVFQGHSHTYYHHETSGIHFVELPSTAYSSKDQQPLGWVRARFDNRGCDLELRVVAGDQSRHGEHLRLDWRSSSANRAA